MYLIIVIHIRPARSSPKTTGLPACKFTIITDYWPGIRNWDCTWIYSKFRLAVAVTCTATLRFFRRIKRILRWRLRRRSPARTSWRSTIPRTIFKATSITSANSHPPRTTIPITVLYFEVSIVIVHLVGGYV